MFFLPRKKHSAKKCQKSRKCGIDGSDKTHNRLLHQKKKQQFSAEKPKDSTNLTSNVESVLDLLQIARVRIFGENRRFQDTLAACYTGTTRTWVDEKVLEKLDITGELISFNVTGMHGTQLTTCKLAQAKIGPVNSAEQSCLQLTVNSRESMQVGKSVYDLCEMKKSYPY